MDNDLNLDSLYTSQLDALVNNNQLFSVPNNSSGSIINVYPNPANSTIIVEYTCSQKGKFELKNRMGQVVLSTELSEGKRKVQMQVHSFSAGMYYYKCSFEGCETVLGKLSIIH
ncbi:MAG: T9SS type A sorting domain-containing protein [Bacteroidetes bacterium]|nr:T9SS type A sorting domain-containing protein [Bacteroidota bacterium]